MFLEHMLCDLELDALVALRCGVDQIVPPHIVRVCLIFVLFISTHSVTTRCDDTALARAPSRLARYWAAWGLQTGFFLL